MKDATLCLEFRYKIFLSDLSSRAAKADTIFRVKTLNNQPLFNEDFSNNGETFFTFSRKRTPYVSVSVTVLETVNTAGLLLLCYIEVNNLGYYMELRRF